MHRNLGDDQQRQRDQEADVDLYVKQERYGHAPAQHLPFGDRFR